MDAKDFVRTESHALRLRPTGEQKVTEEVDAWFIKTVVSGRRTRRPACAIVQYSKGAGRPARSRLLRPAFIRRSAAAPSPPETILLPVAEFSKPSRSVR